MVSAVPLPCDIVQKQVGETNENECEESSDKEARTASISSSELMDIRL
jgi:hypothetical protein